MNKLKEMRLKNGLKVSDVAKKMGCSEMAIYNYENNKRGLKSFTLKKIAELYNCKIDDLID